MVRTKTATAPLQRKKTCKVKKKFKGKSCSTPTCAFFKIAILMKCGNKVKEAKRRESKVEGGSESFRVKKKTSAFCSCLNSDATVYYRKQKPIKFWLGLVLFGQTESRKLFKYLFQQIF